MEQRVYASPVWPPFPGEGHSGTPRPIARACRAGRSAWVYVGAKILAETRPIAKGNCIAIRPARGLDVTAVFSADFGVDPGRFRTLDTVFGMGQYGFAEG